MMDPPDISTAMAVTAPIIDPRIGQALFCIALATILAFSWALTEFLYREYKWGWVFMGMFAVGLVTFLNVLSVVG
jgi:hypothetical protein